MPHCININHPDYKSLVRQASKYNMGQRLLKARIAAWQSLTDNHDIFPSITEVMDMGNIEKARQHIKDESPITLESIEKGDLPILKETIARIILKDFHTDINDVYESFRKATNNSLSDYDNRIAFKSILDKITNSREKKAFVEYLKKEGNSDTDFNTFFFELFNEFQNKGRYILKDRVGNQILNVFEKVENLFIGMRENYPILRAYYQNLNREYIKKQNDDRIFRELKGRVRVVHTGMTQEEASELIDKKERELRGKLSNRAKIYYTQEKYDTKGRTSTYIYFRKPSFDDYNLRTENNRDFLRNNRKDLEIQRERLFDMSNITSSREVLQKLVESNPNDALSKHLLDFLPGETSIEFIDKDYLIRDGRKVSGIYYANENKIYLPRTGLTWETITHEIIHSITAHYLENNDNDQAVQDFNKLYEYARELLGDKNYYELTNKHEFMTGLFSNNNKFLNELKELQPTSEVGEYKNLFQELWSKIIEFLGIKKENSLYHQAFAVATNVIANHRDYILDIQEWADIQNKEDLIAREKEIMEADFPWLNNSFASMANEVIVINSPFSNALKNLNNKFNPTMQREMRETLTSLFSGIIDAHAEENHTLTRREVIDKITPAGLFHELRQEIEAYRDHFIEEGVDPSIVSNLESLIENFEDVLISAIPDINWLESLNFNPNKYNVEERGPNLANPFYTELVLDESMPIDEEAVPIDGWMVNFRHQSIRDSMTPKVKKALRNVMLTDAEGNIEYNSLGFAKKLNLEQVQYDLLEKLKHMGNAKDLKTDLESLAKEKPWVNSLIDYLENDEELTVQFFVVMNKAFRNYQVTRLIDNPNGSVDVKTISINETENINLWTSSWKSNLENGMVYSSSTIYKSDLTFNMENIDNNIKFLDEFSKELLSIKRQGEEELQKFISSKIIDIKNQLNAIGIDLVTSQVKQLLDDIYAENPDRTARTVYNIENILERVKLINQWVKTQLNEGKEISPVDILEKNRGNFRTIALQVSESLEALSEPHVRENGKGYSSYTQTSYLDRLINSLTDQRNDKERFDDFLKEEYKQYALLYDEVTGIYRIPWLNDLTDARTGASARKSMWYFEELKFGRTEYSDLSPEQYSRLLISQYFAYGDEVAAFHAPILADAPAAEFIRYKKITLNYKENIANQMLNIFRYEYDRIKLVRERRAIKEKQDKENKLKPEHRLQDIDNFDKLGHEFVMLSFLNEHIEKIDELASKGDSASKLELMNLVKNSIIENLDTKARKSFDYLASLNMFTKTEDGRYKYLDTFGITADNIQDKMTEYFYNSYFATANIIMLTTTDLAYYKDVEDFQKRNKQIHAPGDHLYTEATYRGVKIGKEKETYIVLKDIKEASDPTTTEAMSKIMDENPNLKEGDKKTIESIYESNDISDAQALRSLDSYKTVIAMHQGWNDRFENAYQNLKNNTWSLDDYNVIFNAIKPFVYTQYAQDTGILVDPNDETKGTKKVKVATQHKNSEAILLPQMAKHYKSERLKGVIEAMKDGEIDVVMFKSAVKEGSQGVIDVSDFKSSKEISKHILSFKGNNEYFKTLNYKDYRIQQPTPENLQDAWTKVGSQLRRILTLDLPQGNTFTIRGKEYKTEELLELFDNTLIEDGLQAFFEVESIFQDKKQLQEILEKELAGNDNYAIDLINAVQLSSDGNFVLPLYDPAHSSRLQQLMHSIWKSRVSERKIKGGSAVNMSSFGVSDKLRIEYHEVEGKTAIKYIEAYLPFWSNETPLNWFNYMNKDTGIIEVQKLIDDKIISEDMLEMIGYRVPTEDAYSILPIKVVGFLHRNVGEQIILPREITSRVGLDFDIDSLYLLIKEFRIRQEYDYETAWSDFYMENKDQLQLLREGHNQNKTPIKVSELFKEHRKEWIEEEQIEETVKIKETREDVQQYKRDVGITQNFKKWFKGQRENYVTKEFFETIHPDLEKDVKEMTKAERGNLFIEMAQSILSNPVTAFKQTSPGNFDGLRATARRLNLLAQGVDYTWEQLEKMSLKELENLTGKSKLDMMDFTTQISLHKQNMTAGKIIGMSAIHSVNHSLRQRTKIGISKENVITAKGDTLEFDRFYLNGEFRQSLHDTYAADGKTLISKNNSEYTAASVDAVKDPVLSSFNLNMFTADTLLSLVGAGYSNNSVGLLMRQPIIEELTAMYFKGQEEGKNEKQVIDELGLKYKKILNNIGVLDFISRYENKERSKEKLYNKTLAHNINLNAKLKNLSPQKRADFNSKNRKQIQDYYLSQYRILLNFKQMLSLGDAVSSLIMATRADSSSGMAGPTNTATLDKISRITRYRDSLKKENAILINADIISEGVPSENKGENREESYRNLLRSTKLGFIQSFATLGLVMNAETMKEHFPHFGKAMRQRIKYFESKYSPTDYIPVAIQERIVNEYITYFMTQFEEFSSDRSRYYLTEFPDKFIKWKNDNPELMDNHFIRNLSLNKATKDVPISHIILRTAGSLSPSMRDSIIRDWESLLYNEKYNKMATELLIYTFHRNGLNFGGDTFAHLAPVAVRIAMGDYRDNIMRLLDVSDKVIQENDYIYEDIFFEQLIRNFSKDSRMVLTLEESVFFVDDNGDVLEKVLLGEDFVPSELYKEGAVLPFFNVRVGKELILYKTIEQEDGRFLFKRIDPLNIHRATSNYSYDNSGLESHETLIKEVIQENLEREREAREAYFNDPSNYVDVTETAGSFGNFVDNSLLNDTQSEKRETPQEDIPAHTLEDFYDQIDYDREYWREEQDNQQEQPLTKEQEDALYWEQEEEFLKWLDSQNPNEIQDIIDNC